MRNALCCQVQTSGIAKRENGPGGGIPRPVLLRHRFARIVVDIPLGAAGGRVIPTLSDRTGFVKSDRLNEKSTRLNDLFIARQLVLESPLVLAYAHKDTSFSLQPEWQRSTPDELTLHRWLNGVGDMLAVRTGIRYDVFDFDTQNAGHLAEFLNYAASLNHASLTVQAICATPSGGYHLYVNALNRRKCPIARGVDYQGNLGIAFIPPSRKLSKLTGNIESYRWIDYAPGGPDSGDEIYQALIDWPDHRPQPKAVAKSRGGDGHRGLTRSQLQQYRREGLSVADNHDDTLRDIVWSLCMWQSSEEYALEVWQDVVDRTEPKSGRRPFESRDFDRHWRGAERKLRGAP